MPEEGIPSRGTPLRFAPFRPLPLSPASPLIGNTVYTYDKRGNILSAERYALKPRPLESVLYSYTGDILSSCTTDQQTVSFSHDALGRMTSDGLAGTTIAYNHLDKPRIISKNHVNSGNYSYLADGTLVDVEDGLGLGLVYRGSLIYKKLPSSLGSLEFESAGFEGGRVTPGGVKYHLTDHLGSVVMVLDGMSGTVDEANRYGEYGARTQLEGTSATAGRYHFSGKEDQDKTLGFPYTDFGARHLSTALRRWLVQDPLSEKYYGISPYTYCDGDPVNMVDPNGESIRVSPEYQQAFMDALTAVFDKYADCFSFDEDGYLTYSQGDKKQLSREASSVLKGLLTVISQQTVTNVYFTTNITLPSGTHSR